jgi:hypothetical protein
MKRLTGLFLTAALVLTVEAQTLPQSEPQPVQSQRLGTSSLSMGYMHVGFRYFDGDSTSFYRFDGPARSFILSSKKASLIVAYGTMAADSLGGLAGSRLIDVALLAGGNQYLIRPEGPLPIGIYIPIRMNLGYRNLLERDTDITFLSPGNELPVLHLAQAGLAAGAGASLRLPSDLPIIKNNLIGFASLVWGVGGMANVRDGLDDIYFLRTTDFDLEVKLERLLNNLGATVGYTYRTQTWDTEAIGPARNLLDRVATTDVFTQRSRQHIMRVGINF